MTNVSINKSSSWLDINSSIHRFNMNAEYRIILKEYTDYNEDKYTTIYMNSCTEYELYFNDSVAEHVYGCINVDDLSHYEHRIKRQRDQRLNSTKYNVYKVQMCINNKNKWTVFNERYFNVHNDYRLILEEEDSQLTVHQPTLTLFEKSMAKQFNIDERLNNYLVFGYVRKNDKLYNKGFNVIANVIWQYYNNCGNRGYINMEQVVKRELYFTPSTANHYYGCITSINSETWHYRFQGNCVKRVDDKSFDCYKIQQRQQDKDNKYEPVDDKDTEFNINYQYRIRLIQNGGYIVVERVTKNALYFGVSTSRFWVGCVGINNKHSWHYVDKASSKLERVGKGNYTAYSIECKK